MIFDSQKAVDISRGELTASLREGHLQIDEVDLGIIDVVKRFASEFGRRPRVMDIGCGNGFFPARLLEAVPEIDFVARESWEIAVKELKQRFEGTPVRIFTAPLADWDEPLDVVINWSRHHHWPRTYLDHIKRFMAPDGVMVLADEFCPEYCFGEYAERIHNADRIYLGGGYVLVDDEEVAAYEKDGTLPDIAREMEKLRLKALWRWYRYVLDYAIEHDHMHAAVLELRAVRDDLDTDCGHELKLSPLIVEKELELKGFRKLACHTAAPNEPLDLRSGFVYEYGL
uniref:Methyltransferase domain-containing protein n=1 Tax=Candidatus Kentrum sp. FW TaxID=2126338 RepID=A0A450U1R2_9GAMM|nr:MAG: Methyltransferase domain-containing protein [Candidatus Kentron sp. FW]